MKKILLMIAVGAFNTMHSMLHIIQFLQSVFLAADSHELDAVMEHPAFTAVMAIIGISSLAVGIKDFIHHRKCHS